jgi:methoxymalonate biosynthesis acyl carrier protein
MSIDNATDRVKAFLGQFVANTDITPDLNLFTSGLINSLFALQLVLFIEKEFGIEITNEDMDLKNFCSLNAISSFVSYKKTAAE